MNLFREMLMKLVMTMSKDEIFIRSKNIMNEQKKKNGKSWGGVLGGGGGKNAGKSKKLSDFSSSGGEGGGKVKAGKNAAGKRKISKNEIGNVIFIILLLIQSFEMIIIEAKCQFFPYFLCMFDILF